MTKLRFLATLLFLSYSYLHAFNFNSGFNIQATGIMSSPIKNIFSDDEYPPESKFTEIKTDTSVEHPDYLESYEDDNFHSKVTRISNRAEQKGNKHAYPKQGSAWNKDMSIIRMGYRLYDNETFKELSVTKGNASNAYRNVGSPRHGTGDIRWSHTDSNMLYVLNSSKKFIAVTIDSNKEKTAKKEYLNLSNYEDVSIGNNEGNLDYSDKYIVLSAKKPNDDKVYALLYKLGDKRITWEKEIPHALWSAYAANYFDWISVDPRAEHIVTSVDNKIYLYDMNLNFEQQLASEANHGDIGVDQNGNSVYVQFKFQGEQGIWSYNLNNLNKTKLLASKYNGGHVSCRNYQRSGWCYLSTSEEGYREVFALKLDDGSGTVQRYAQTHSSTYNTGYVQVNVSPDGKKLLFASDWNVDDDIDTYQVSYPFK